jgi:hypothetical protein
MPRQAKMTNSAIAAKSAAFKNALIKRAEAPITVRG